MDFNSIATYSKQFGRVLQKNSPTILTAIGVVSVVGAIFEAVRATPKALEMIEQEKDFRRDEYGDHRPLDVLDVVQVTWKEYIPTMVLGGSAITCMIASNNIHLRRNAALLSLVALSESALKEYQDKVRSEIGDKKEEKIRGSIAQDHVIDNPPTLQNTVIITDKSHQLMRDSLSGRYFYSDVESVRRTINDFNEQLMKDRVLSLNDLYSDLRLEPMAMGSQMGWDIERNGQLNIFFSAALTEDKQSCVVLEHRNLPTSLWG